ncbi:hypothetical protein JHK86_049634 [Glycine max]|nr:hypothetical protein JHK86_049634 [Glycine max]
MRELSSDRFVVEGGEGDKEMEDDEVRVESEKGLKEVRDREGAKELGESVGDIDDWGERVGDMVGEAPEAEGSTVMYEQRVIPDIEYDHFAIVELQDKAILEVVEHFAVLGLRCGIQAGIADLLWHRVSVNKIRGIFVLYRNVSHDQFQAFSYVPSDSFAFDSDSSFVITPPPILEGRDIVKCYGTKALVVPMHSGILQGDKSNSLLYNSVDNRKKICWNEDFHSKYNGCRWKGGRLRLEKAKEDCLVRLKREWEQGALDYATQKPPTAASEEEMPNTTQSSKSNTKHLNIFFPRLRKNLAWHSNFSRKQLRKNQTLGRTD